MSRGGASVTETHNKNTSPISDEEKNHAWEKFKNQFREEIGPFEFQVFVNDMRLEEITEEKVLIQVAKPFDRNWLKDKHGTSLQKAFHQAFGDGRELSISVKGKEETTTSPSTTSNDKSSQNVNRSFPFANKMDFNPHFTFDRFVVGKSNQYAYSAAKAVAENPADSYNPLFLYGDVGLGKTHLLQAVGQGIKTRWEQASVKYISAEQFMNEILRTIENKTIKEFQYRFRKNIDVLLVDDVQFLAKSDAAKKEFFHTFEELAQNGKTAVFCSDRPPHEIPKIEERLRSRFEMGLIVDIQPPDFETRIAILRKKADDDGLVIPDDVIEFIASNVISNVRVLKGCLNNLAALGSMTGQTLTVELAKEQLSNYLENQPGVSSDPIDIQTIQETVSEHFNLSSGDLESKRRTKAIAEPRQVAMYLSRKYTNASYADIGDQFGGRDHSTVIHAEKKIDKACEEQTELGDQVRRLESQLR